MGRRVQGVGCRVNQRGGEVAGVGGSRVACASARLLTN